MTAYKLQFIIPSALTIVAGLIILGLNKFDKMYANADKSNIKNIKRRRYLWAIFCILLGIAGVLNAIFDGPVMGYIIPPPK